MVSREEAAEIARLDALAHGLGTSVGSVLLPEEISFRVPSLYMVDLRGCWVAYIERIGPPALRSSTIVVVRRDNGCVLYRGSANDEG